VLEALALSVFPNSAALACTLCHSDLAREVRAAVFGHDFWLNVAVSVVPFAILAAIATLVHGRGARK
jgi:hypothetical protein